MLVPFQHSLLVAALPLGHAFQADTGINTCPWNGLSADLEQLVHSSLDMDVSADDTRTPRGSYVYKGIDDLKRNRWRAAPDCFDKYCVYTNDDFFGKGISLITTASNHGRVKQIQMPRTAMKLGYEKTRIVEIPGRGRGLVATRPIRRGERIMAAKPALLVHREAFRELPIEDMYYLMDMAVDNLPTARKESYMAQASSMGSHKITDIFFTNTFQLTVGGHDGFHYGNFPEVSVINHDCRPK